MSAVELSPAEVAAVYPERSRHIETGSWVAALVLRLADECAKPSTATDGACPGCAVRVFRLDPPSHAGEHYLAVHEARCAEYDWIEAAWRMSDAPKAAVLA